MNKQKALILIVICSIIIFLERSLPWLIFGKNKMPKFIKRLSDLLPSALMIILLIYSLVNITDKQTLYPVIIASFITFIFHYFKRNQILSIIIGTATYMFLINFI